MVNLLTEALESQKVSIPKNLDEQRKNQREKVIEILSQPLLPCEQEKVYSQLTEFVKLQFGYDLVQRYPNISPSIFDLEREQKIEINGDYYSNGIYNVKTLSVVKVPFETTNAGIYKIRKKGIRLKDKNEREIDLSCKIPEITSEARAAYADSISFCAELLSKAYKDDLISKILLKDVVKDIPLPIDSDYFLVWAPSVWDAKIVEKDPAIFMQYTKWYFLVEKWDIPEERSLDALLREFGETMPKN